MNARERLEKSMPGSTCRPFYMS